MREGDGCGVLEVRKPIPDEAACQKDRWIGQFIFSKCLHKKDCCVPLKDGQRQSF